MSINTVDLLYMLSEVTVKAHKHADELLDHFSGELGLIEFDLRDYEVLCIHFSGSTVHVCIRSDLWPKVRHCYLKTEEVLKFLESR